MLHSLPSVVTTPPPGWPSWMGNREQRRELTLEIPKGGQGNTKVCSKVGVTETRRGPAVQSVHPLQSSTRGQAGGRGHPNPATPHPNPQGSARWLIQVTGTNTPSLDFLFSSEVSPGGRVYMASHIPCREVWPPPLTWSWAWTPVAPTVHLWRDLFLLLEGQEPPPWAVSTCLCVCVCVSMCVTPGTATTQKRVSEVEVTWCSVASWWHRV